MGRRKNPESDMSAATGALTVESLRERAGARSFAAAGGYEESVYALQVYKDAIHADVAGTRLYSIRLEIGPSGEFFCSCPYHDQSGAFCKHLVAAGLAYLKRLSGTTFDAGDAPLAQLDAFVAKQSKAFLVRLVMEQAVRNPTVRRELYALADIEIDEDDQYFEDDDW